MPEPDLLTVSLIFASIATLLILVMLNKTLTITIYRANSKEQLLNINIRLNIIPAIIMLGAWIAYFMSI